MAGEEGALAAGGRLKVKPAAAATGRVVVVCTGSGVAGGKHGAESRSEGSPTGLGHMKVRRTWLEGAATGLDGEGCSWVLNTLNTCV